MPINNENEKIALGGDLMIFVSTSGTTYPVAFSNSCGLEIQTEMIQISHKDSGRWAEKIPGEMSWTANSDAIYSYVLSSGSTRNTIDELYVMKKAGIPVIFKFAKTSGNIPNYIADPSAKFFSGKAYISSISVSAANKEVATYSINFEGTGELSIT